MTPAMHCLCVCKGRARVSEHICVHQECLRPAQLWTPDRALTLLWVTPGATPALPVRFSSAALDRLIAGAPVCYITLACDSGLCPQKCQSKERGSGVHGKADVKVIFKKDMNENWENYRLVILPPSLGR